MCFLGILNPTEELTFFSFFFVSIDEIDQELKVLKQELNIEAEIHITMAAEAKQWRISEAKRKHLEQSIDQ